MTYVRVLLEGSGIELPIGSEKAVGFLVTRVVRAKSEIEAVSVAMRKVRSEWSTRGTSAGSPALKVKQVERTTFFRGFLLRQINCTFLSATYAVLARARLGA